MRCPDCRTPLVRTRGDSLLVTGRYMLIKSNSLIVACKGCRKEVLVKATRTVVRATKQAGTMNTPKGHIGETDAD